MSIFLKAVGRMDKGRIYKTNEDVFTVTDLSSGRQICDEGFQIGNKGGLLAVVDGLDANPTPIAGAIVVASLVEYLSVNYQDDEILDLLSRSVEAANLNVFDAGKQPDHEGIVAQLQAVLIHQKLAYIVSVGEARIYLIRCGKIYQLTVDQTAHMQIPINLLSNIKIWPRLGQSQISMALRILELRSSDIFVLCSDGLHNCNVASQEILQIISETKQYQEACSKLLDLANERGGYDNITVLIAEVNGEELKEPNPDEPFEQTLQVIREFDYYS